MDLSAFVGCDLNQIALGRFQVQFHFAGAGIISAESGWELRGPEGELVDAEEPHEGRDLYRLHRVLDAQVIRYALDPPRSFTLFLDSGHALTVFDGSDQYESVLIRLESGSIIVI